MDRRLDQDLGPDVARRGRHRQAQRRRHGLRTVVASVLIGGLTLIGIGLVAMALWVDDVSAGIDISTMPEHLPGVNSTILDAHGNQLARVASTENRIPEPASRISPWLVRATIAIEDRRFYQHGGVDYLATLRALWADMTAGQIVQGGSTIEQQLAKLLYLNDSQTLTRKVQEAVIANQIADRWSRSRILTTYLNVVPYGGVTYGCEAAARLYFGRHCADLTPLQAATLAGLPRSPTDYDPLLHPRAAIDRRNEVLSAMASNADLTPRFAARLSRRPLGLYQPGQQVVHQAYFVQYVEHRLRKRFGERRLQRGGLVVSTTLDQRLRARRGGRLRQCADVARRPGRRAGGDGSADRCAARVRRLDQPTGRALRSAVPGAPAGRLGLQAVRAAGGDAGRPHRSGDHRVLRRGAVHDDAAELRPDLPLAARGR